MDTISEEIKLPQISKRLLEYLADTYTVEILLYHKGANNDETIGYIKGVREVCSHLSMLYEEQRR